MRALIQRVTHAEVTIHEMPDATPIPETKRSIEQGLCILLGVGENDTEAELTKLWNKMRNLRIFEDEAGKTNLSLTDAHADLLIVSQFTLFASCKKGNRPSFGAAKEPHEAKRMYEQLLEMARADGFDPAHGEFGAHMSIDLTNDGPFTIWLDTDEL